MRDEAETNGGLSEAEKNEVDLLLGKYQYPMVAEDLRRHFTKDQDDTLFEETFDPPGARPAEIHRALFRLAPPLILTTNYDRLLEDAYAQEFLQAANVFTYQQSDQVQRYLLRDRVSKRPAIFKLHGSIDQPDDIILSERDYRDLIYRQPGYRIMLSAIFLTHVVLMLGFSFADRELMLLLESVRESLKRGTFPDYIFLARSNSGSVERRRWRDDFGVEVIPYDPSPDHREVLELVEHLAEIARTPQPA